MSSTLLQRLRKGYGKPTRKTQLKGMLASSYWKDANDFLWRVDILLNSDFQHRSFLGKVFVDYLMAVECALKSVIIYSSANAESVEDAYKTARKKSHKLGDLLDEALKRAKSKVKGPDAEAIHFIKSMTLTVSARYELDLLYLHFNSNAGDSIIDNTIRDEEYMKAFRKAAYAIFEFASRASKRSPNRMKPSTARAFGKVQEAFAKLTLK